MRRFLVTTLAVPALLLSACSSDEEPSVEEPAASASSEPTEDVAEETTEDVAAETAEETAEPTEDIAGATEGPESDGEVEGGAEGQAAAEVTKEFMVALSNADPEICGLLMDFTGSGPMSASEEDMSLCEEILPTTLEGMITEEQASIIELIEVNGADVQGDTATVDKDNFSELFGEGFGDDAIALQKFEGTWFIDLDNSFQGAASN